jgi:hypothetical protein
MQNTCTYPELEQSQITRTPLLKFCELKRKLGPKN